MKRTSLVSLDATSTVYRHLALSFGGYQYVRIAISSGYSCRPVPIPGGYFGVPISNFLGWSFTVYVFFQLFALYVRERGRPDDSSRAIPITHYLQVILVYMWTGVWFVLVYLLSATMQVTDAVGQVWRTSNIYETSAIMAIYTMVFISILALVTLFRDQLMQKKSQL